MAHLSTWLWLQGTVGEEKYLQLNPKSFKEKGIRADMMFYANVYKFELYHHKDGKFLKDFNQMREMIE